MDQPSRHQEDREQHAQRVGVGGVAVEIEPEAAQQRPDAHALEPVGAAGQPVGAVGRLVEQHAQTERDHDQGQVLDAGDDEARGVPDQARDG